MPKPSGISNSLASSLPSAKLYSRTVASAAPVTTTTLTCSSRLPRCAHHLQPLLGAVGQERHVAADAHEAVAARGHLQRLLRLAGGCRPTAPLDHQSKLAARPGRKTKRTRAQSFSLGERFRGCDGQSVAAILATHPGLTLLADDRELLAALIYYVRPHPFGAVEWNPIPGVTDQWRLVNNIGTHRGEDFLAVTVHGLVDQMRPDFARLTQLATIATHSGPGGGTVYTVYVARGFRGDGRP